MRLDGIIEIGKQHLADEETLNLLLDNFTVAYKEDHGDYVAMLCISDYFDEIQSWDRVPHYHVDLKRDDKTGKLYIWRVTRIQSP